MNIRTHATIPPTQVHFGQHPPDDESPDPTPPIAHRMDKLAKAGKLSGLVVTDPIVQKRLIRLYTEFLQQSGLAYLNLHPQTPRPWDAPDYLPTTATLRKEEEALVIDLSPVKRGRGSGSNTYRVVLPSGKVSNINGHYIHTPPTPGDQEDLALLERFMKQELVFGSFLLDGKHLHFKELTLLPWDDP